MCKGKKGRKTVQFFYNTGLLGSATPPNNIVGTQNTALSPLDIVYFTNQFESWKILDVYLDYKITPTISPNPTGLEQNTFEFQLVVDFHNNAIPRAFERSAVLDGTSRVVLDTFRRIKFSRDVLQYDFKEGSLFAQGMMAFRTSYFCKTSGSGAVGINLEFTFTLNIEEQ